MKNPGIFCHSGQKWFHLARLFLPLPSNLLTSKVAHLVPNKVGHFTSLARFELVLRRGPDPRRSCLFDLHQSMAVCRPAQWIAAWSQALHLTAPATASRPHAGVLAWRQAFVTIVSADLFLKLHNFILEPAIFRFQLGEILIREKRF